MGIPLRVLVVEDSEDDAVLIIHELRRGGYEPTFKRVDTAAVMSAALDQQTWDLVISDYSMPRFSGLVALELLKETGGDLPFIIVSGTIGEDIAVAAMKAGAHDYIMKDKLVRLVPAVEREMGEFKIRQEHKRMEKEVFRKNAVLEAINEIVLKALACENNEEVASICLSMAERLTGSKFGFIGEVNQAGRLDTIALSDIGWDRCRIPQSNAALMIKDMEIRGIWSLVIKDGKSQLINDPSSHPDRVGTPEGHIPLTSFLGVPLKNDRKTVGLIALANKESGYDPADQEAIEALCTAFFEVLSRKRVEKALMLANAQMEELLSASPTVIYRRKAEGNYAATFVSKNAKRLLGYKTQKFTDDPQFWTDHIHPEDAPRVFAELAGLFEKGYHTHEYRFLHQDGTYRWIFDELRLMRDVDGTPTDIIGNWIEITRHKQAVEDKNKLETQLRQAQKMEALGTLAGGIAHDFNNILSAVVGYSELAMDDAPQGTSLRDKLEEVLKAGYRARDLVKQILTFSRQTEQQLQPVQVKLIVKEALKLLRPSLPSTIEMRQNIQSENLVLADPTQIHQIIMNLCTNAGHAMREKGGMLEVSLTDEELDSNFTGTNPKINPGSYVKLTVSDTGHGIPAEVLENIFDPFFTTKEPGEGTGLGLAVVHGIVENHGGVIKVYSEPGKGTTFHGYFPTIKREVEPESEIKEPLPTGNERVLFVDDENIVANLGKQMLEPLGYEVTIRTSSIEALELFKARADDFDIVVTDMTMPNMTGEELAREIMRIRPDIPIILCTGFSEMITEESAKAMGIRAFIMKPIIRNQIVVAIRKVLDHKD